GGGIMLVDESDWDNGYGFPGPTRHVYLSPGEKHVYYADHQLDGAHLAFTRGKTGEKVFAEDAQNTFAVGETKVFDAELLKPVAALPHTASAAALTSSDQELWYYSALTGRVYYQNIGDLLGNKVLGLRERAPAALASYAFAKLVH